MTNGAREHCEDMLEQTAATSEAREKVIQTMLILVPITILMIVVHRHHCSANAKAERVHPSPG